MSRIFQSSFLVLFSKQNPAATPKQLLGFISATKSEPQIRPKMPTSMLTRRAPSFYSSSSSFLLRFSFAASAARDCALPRGASYSTRALPLSPPPKSISLGVVGALSFSLSFSTAAAAAAEEAEAKAPPTRPDLMPKDVVLYQYEACPFCNKVRAFLDYHDIPYKIVEVNPLSKKEIKWSDYQKVPILVVDGQQMIDSSDIIEKLSNQIQPAEVVIDEEETKWRRWVDEHLVHILSPNIYRTTYEALESFDYITSHGNFSFAEKLSVKYAGAAIMYMVSKKLKKKYNIADERAALYEAAVTWTKALDGKDFLGGSKPNLADLAVFGVLRPIRYLRAGIDMVENTGIGEWYHRMESAVGEPSRVLA